ncbi:MAG: hypothetical protein HYY52_01980 [Candidatus Melainabacteria bacterium]|nr:hypothetical protein [Candidatus Melainabacteria bacterium]
MAGATYLQETRALSTRRYLPWNNFGNIQRNARSFLDNNKTTINYIGNGGASLINLITFINSNWTFLESLQDWLEKISGIWTKFATGTQGLVGGIDLWEKKNLVPFFGNILEIPIAIFSSGFNLWLFRGISQGLGQFFRIIDQRERVSDENGKKEIIGGNFMERGWLKSLEEFLKEIPKIVKELIEKPQNISKLTHGLTLASILQTTGAIIAFVFQPLGALIRNIGGISCDFSLITDENKKITSDGSFSEGKKRGLNLNSRFVQSGLVWVSAAFADELKRVPFIAEKVQGLNFLSYFFDRGASVFYTLGILETHSENKKLSLYDEGMKVNPN